MPSTHNADGTWTHTLSASWMSTYAKCPEQARQRYYRLNPETSSELTALGRACHAAFEAIINQKADTRMLPAYQTYAKEQFVKATQTAGFRWVKYTQEACYAYIDQHLITFVNEVLPGLRPIATEKAFDLPVYNDPFREIRFRGFIDYVDEEGLWDWKTAGQPHKVWEKEKQDLQSVIYPWAYAHLEGKQFEWMDYKVFIHGQHFQTYRLRYNSQKLEWLKFQALQAALLIEANLPHWTMNDQGWWCAPKWCDAWDNCKGKFLSLDGGK